MKKSPVKEKDHARDQAKAQLKSIQEMVEALDLGAKDQTPEGDDKHDEARQTIQEDALSVEVRTGWYTLDRDSDKKPTEYNILLCTGGPACRIIGNLSEHGEPESARIEYQDWGTPWTEYRLTADEESTVLTYCQQFYFGE